MPTRDLATLPLVVVLGFLAGTAAISASSPDGPGVLVHPPLPPESGVDPMPPLPLEPESVLTEPRTAISDLLHAWERAWEDRRLPAYVASYLEGYRPPDAETHEAWRRARAQRILRASGIDLEIADLRIELLDAGRASATFAQRYSDDVYRDRVRKRLDLVRTEGSWRISAEIVLEELAWMPAPARERERVTVATGPQPVRRTDQASVSTRPTGQATPVPPSPQ